MYRASECVFCGSRDLSLEPALVSDFIADYVLGAGPERTDFAVCGACGGGFFADRFTDDEAERLYAGYRGERYFEVRHRHEPWYTKAVNAALDGSMNERRDFIEGQLRNCGMRFDAVRRALDFGGNTGALFPSEISGAERWVVDPSDAPLAPGLHRAKRLDDLERGSFEFVMAIQVLEHVSEPRSIVADLVGLLAPGGTLYLEVPLESRRSFTLPGSVQAGYLDALRHLRLLRRLVDFGSVGARRTFGFVPPLGFFKLHEHINVHSLRALEALVPPGFFVEAHEVSVPIEGGSVPALSAVARRIK